MRLYHIVSDREEEEAILSSAFEDRPSVFRSDHETTATEPLQNGVALTDDPILLYEHCGCHVVRLDLSCSEDELAPFEDLRCEGLTDHAGPIVENAWLRTRVPMIGTTYRHWTVPATWLRPRTIDLGIVSERPEDLWAMVARDRRPGPAAPSHDPLTKQLATLARIVHCRPFDGRRFDEDRRPGTIAIQESAAVAHFEKLVERLAELKVPLKECGWLLAEAARRVAIDSHRLGTHVRQMRAATLKSEDAQAQDDAEVKKEAVRLRSEGVPVALLRRRLLAKFGPARVPSEKVIRSRWLRYVPVRSR